MNAYTEYAPNQESSRFVKKLWMIDNSQQNTSIKDQIILPNGCFHIGFLTGQGIEVITADKNYHLTEGAYFCSQFSHALNIHILPKTKILLIKLTTWTLAMYPNLDMSQLLDAIIQIDFPNNSVNTTPPPAYYREPQRLMQFINQYFEKLNRAQPQQNEIEKICLFVENQKRAIKVTDIVSFSSLSQRSLQIKFKKATGLTLKKYLKIRQLRKSIDDMNQTIGTTGKLTDIAYANNYFDQTHFIKTFKAITQMTPKKLDTKQVLFL
jgi:AraC-like DNA-binding protein